MALEPSLWRTLPEEILHLVFARLPVVKIGQLQILSKDWKWNIDCKHSEFNRVFNATIHSNMFTLMSSSWTHKACCRLYDVQADKWHIFKYNMDSSPIQIGSPPDGGKDGGLFCSIWQWKNYNYHFQIVVVNPLTQRKMKLPPLLRMGSRESNHVQVKIVQLTMDWKKKEYKVHVVAYMKSSGSGLFVQVYNSHVNAWSVMESREGRIIGWNQKAYLENYRSSTWWPCMYNCEDGNLHHFNPSDIATGFTKESKCSQLVNDHFFVLHKKNDESTSGKYYISELHLPEKATSWVKLGVHNCDPNICDSSGKRKSFSLLACKGFLIVQCWEVMQDYDRGWLYNLSTCAWQNLPNKLKFKCNKNLVMCEMSWSACL